MSSVDVGLVIVAVLGTYNGYKAGFIMSLISLLAVILGLLGGIKLMGYGMAFLQSRFSVTAAMLPYISFGIVFLVIVLAVSLLGRALKASIDKNFLGSIDQALGGIMGLFKVLFMTSTCLWILSSMSIFQHAAWIEKSWLYPKVAGFAPWLTSIIANVIPTFRGIF